MNVFGATTLFLAAAFCVTLAVGDAQAQARSSGSVNGISYTVVGGSNQSISGAGDGLEVVTDGVRIRVLPDAITVDGTSYPVEPFDEVLIDQTNGDLRISVDGRDVLSAAPTEEAEVRETDDMLADARFFFADGDRPVGPVTMDQLRGLVAAGTISPQTLAWEGGTESWVPLQDIPAFSN